LKDNLSTGVDFRGREYGSVAELPGEVREPCEDALSPVDLWHGPPAETMVVRTMLPKPGVPAAFPALDPDPSALFLARPGSDPPPIDPASIGRGWILALAAGGLVTALLLVRLLLSR